MKPSSDFAGNGHCELKTYQAGLSRPTAAENEFGKVYQSSSPCGHAASRDTSTRTAAPNTLQRPFNPRPIQDSRLVLKSILKATRPVQADQADFLGKKIARVFNLDHRYPDGLMRGDADDGSLVSRNLDQLSRPIQD